MDGRQEEQEKLRKEQQREESRLKAIEQSEKDKQMAQQKKQEPYGAIGIRFHQIETQGVLNDHKWVHSDVFNDQK